MQFHYSCGTASATVNIESMRKSDLKEGLYNNISFNLGYTDGNTNVLNMKTKLRSDYIASGHHIFLAATFQRGEKDDRRYMNKGFAHLRGIRPVSERLSGELFVQKEFNDFTLLKDRNLIGAGVRIPLIRDDADSGSKSSLKLYLGIGVMQEEEVIDYRPKEKANIFRSTNYLSCRWQIDNRLSLSATTYYQPSLEDSNDYRILFDGILGFDITEKLTFNIDVNYRYDNQPPIGVENYDLEITNGLSYSF